MKTFYVNARYLIVPLMTIATIFGIFLGNNFVWLGVILFGFNTIIDTLTKDIHLRADFDEDGNSFGIKKFQYAVMYLMLPTFIVLQIILAWRLFHYTSAYPIEVLSLFGITYQSGISGINLIGATLSAGLWAGLGIIYGHELSHNRKEGFFISRLIMSLSGASHFTYAHVYNHHLDLGHEDDPATARALQKLESDQGEVLDVIAALKPGNEVQRVGAGMQQQINAIRNAFGDVKSVI